jgi:periplasmic divalent cation tolerance protein
MSDIAVLWSTFADRAEAERAARIVVDERLAACANILAQCDSIYHWRGAVERAQEVPVLFKTTVALAGRLRMRIEGLHGYEVPVVETWPVAASAAVAAWVAGETG